MRYPDMTRHVRTVAVLIGCGVLVAVILCAAVYVGA